MDRSGRISDFKLPLRECPFRFAPGSESVTAAFDIQGFFRPAQGRGADPGILCRLLYVPLTPRQFRSQEPLRFLYFACSVMLDVCAQNVVCAVVAPVA